MNYKVRYPSFLLDESERIKKIEIERIEANKDQPRKTFDQVAIDQLSKSIKQYGILQPLIVSPKAKDETRFIIIAGERRWLAAKKAGLKTVPVIVRTIKELERLEIAIVENVQRVDLSPLEQALSIERLHELFNMSYSSIANKLGKAENTIINIVRLLQLPDTVKNALNDRTISEGHARTLISLKNNIDAQNQLLDSIIKNNWSVRQAEQFVTGIKKQNKSIVDMSNHMARETPETQMLSRSISAPVTIRRTAKGGKLEIGFTSDQNLKDIINQILI
ncbi:MAG TPA: ParB/RepB/Spo0J family partition protein [Candidatus Saccharimonadales bacterium]|nr:ParB/RepB/Spo0J family partition protein [Candidatus Saccharimonadales bacterium]